MRKIKERTMNFGTLNNTPEKNTVVASRFTACNSGVMQLPV
jgi:hypothetical protein